MKNLTDRISRTNQAAQAEREDSPERIQSGPALRLQSKTNLLAKTQEAAQADLLISVKLLDENGEEKGTALDATLIATDGCTAANAALPRIKAAKTVIVSKISGTWYVINPTIIDSGECTPA